MPTSTNDTTAWTQISVSSTSTCAIASGSALLSCWGSLATGGLGDGTTSAHYYPIPVSGGGQWKAVCAANTFTCGIQIGGTLYCFGVNSNGQLGISNTTTMLVPTATSGAYNWTVIPTAVANSASHMCGIQASGGLWCWVRVRTAPLYACP